MQLQQRPYYIKPLQVVDEPKPKIALADMTPSQLSVLYLDPDSAANVSIDTMDDALVFVKLLYQRIESLRKQLEKQINLNADQSRKINVLEYRLAHHVCSGQCTPSRQNITGGF